MCEQTVGATPDRTGGFRCQAEDGNLLSPGAERNHVGCWFGGSCQLRNAPLGQQEKLIELMIVARALLELFLHFRKTPTGVEQRVSLGTLAHRTQYRFDLA